MTELGATLVVTLDQTNEQIGISSVGSSYNFSSANTFINGGISVGRVSFNGTYATVTASGLAAYDTIRIVDGVGVQGTRVNFDSA